MKKRTKWTTELLKEHIKSIDKDIVIVGECTKAYDLEIYRDILNELEENIKNGKIYRTSKDLRTDISRFRAEKRRSGNNNDTIARGKPDGRVGELYRKKSESKGQRVDGTSSENKSKISYSLTPL